MTDNEKRAHDIAVAMLPTMCKIGMENADEGCGGSERVMSYDVYSDYKKVYEAALEAINKDFA